MDSAKSYDGNLAEEWDIVRSTATALYGLLFEDDGCEGQVADEFQRRTGYELTFSEQRHQGARRSDEDAREELRRPNRRHLRPHQGEEPEEHPSALHFYIDRENELIVIGVPGCHMKTANLARTVAVSSSTDPAIGTDGGILLSNAETWRRETARAIAGLRIRRPAFGTGRFCSIEW